MGDFRTVIGLAAFLFGLGGFLYKWITIDILTSLGKAVDSWANPVSRYLPIRSDTFAIACIIIAFIGLILWRNESD